MRTRARQAIDFLTQQLLRTGTIEPLVAFYFSDHIEQVQQSNSLPGFMA